MEIEAARAVVEQHPLPPAAEAALRHRARLRSTHYSTRIEGNQLTLAEVDRVLAGTAPRLPGRKRERARDVREVRNYWNALLRVEEWAAQHVPLSETLIQRLHALVERGPRAKASAYRTGQNVIRDAASGAIIYLPPEAADIPRLMAELFAWTKTAEKADLPVPLVAGLMHYQFVTIHPYYDGNGRTARLLATLILHRGGYGLNGFFSLEEHHARDLAGYYRALVTHPHHNYYEGRAHADLTPWLEYFTRTLAGVFNATKVEALRYAQQGVAMEPTAVRRLDRRARAVMALFATNEHITSAQVAEVLALSARSARLLLNGWVLDGWLVVADASNRRRRYGLSAKYRQYVSQLSARPRP
jgi:Fic family protein